MLTYVRRSQPCFFFATDENDSQEEIISHAPLAVWRSGCLAGWAEWVTIQLVLLCAELHGTREQQNRQSGSKDVTGMAKCKKACWEMCFPEMHRTPSKSHPTRNPTRPPTIPCCNSNRKQFAFGSARVGATSLQCRGTPVPLRGSFEIACSANLEICFPTRLTTWQSW